MIVRIEGWKGTEFTKTKVRIEAARFARASHLTLVFANSVPFQPSKRTSTLLNSSFCKQTMEMII